MSPIDQDEGVTRQQKALKLFDDLLKDLKKAGAEIPDGVVNALQRYRFAVDTGVDLGNSARSASAALAQYTNKMNKDCGVDDVRLAYDLHYYQARSVDYTLNWKNRNSVLRNFVRATLQRHIPQRICNYLDACR